MINIRANTAKMLKDDFDIDSEVTSLLFEKGIVRESEVMKVLIKDDYIKNVKPKQKRILRNKLALKYCISISLVEKIVLQNNA